jgi:MoaA/NifB/PqqE/SkfB family radical SAM enzyme
MADTLSWAQWNLYESLHYRLRTVAGGRFASFCRPVSIILLVTENCSAKCLHCDIWKNRIREETTLEEWKTLLSDLRNWLGPVHVTISGGEALMKGYTIDLVTHARSIGLFLEILTHGYWKDQNKIERLARANPWKVTMSLDGLGETHTLVRGRPNFWEMSHTSLKTLLRLRKEENLGYTVRLKNVLMSYNMDDTVKLAKFAEQDGVEIFFQPIEQNYNTPDDPQWYLHSENWPKDTNRVIANVRELIAMKKSGTSHIANSLQQLEAMIPYFQDPDASRVAVQTHSAHEKRRSCNALTTLQLQSNGDVTVCTGVPPVGNFRDTPIRKIWESRPHFWAEDCCLEKRCSDAELQQIKPAASLTASNHWHQQ